MKELWWNKGIRVVQYNLQIQDTEQMVPEKIAAAAAKEGANAVVLNAGGIYAWYQSRIPFHHVNEYLPKADRLLENIIACCHERGIRVIGRFDFSKTDDTTYLQHPEWFVQDAAGQPLIFGSKRMGNWSLLMSTCINGGYRNTEFAAPVLEEAINTLDMDGIFFNAPQMEKCFCENCKRKYKQRYGKELPADPKEWESDWGSSCLKDNMEILYRTVKRLDKEMPVILYYGTYRMDGKGLPENLDMRYATADMICTEAQDILSAGKQQLPAVWKPTLNMKLGQSLEGTPRPFGIIHSCPGMDWRHTGLPTAEYEFWMSQIPAANGQIWHSLTGFEETITDKRLLQTVERINKKAAVSDEWMTEAESAANVLLLWNAGRSELGYVEALMEGHIPFDMMDVWHPDAERMRQYKTVILPGAFPVEEKLVFMLQEYVESGGYLLTEKTDAAGVELLAGLLGIREDAITGKNVSAAYGVLEKDGAGLKQGLEETCYIPIKGNLLYVRPLEKTKLCMTLVPPFAPADGVGAPPERASLPVRHTDIPLLLENARGRGKVLTAVFSLSELILEVGLEDLKQLFENCISYLNGGQESFWGNTLPEGVYAYPYQAPDRALVHLVNTIGKRPLRENHPCYDVSFAWRKQPGKKVCSVYSALEHEEVCWKETEDAIWITVKRLKVWDLIVIEQKE